MTREEAILELFLTVKGLCNAVVETNNCIKLLDQKVMALESTMGRVKHGHWIGIDDFPRKTWECNRCGKIIVIDEPPNYCENCGTKMDLDEVTE